MTVEEKLSEWLEQAAPEPPRLVTVDDLRPRSRGRVWLPVLAAACVVLIVLVSVAIANRRTSDHSAPAVSTSASVAPSTPPSSANPTTSAAPPKSTTPPPPARAWQASAAGTLPGPAALVSDGTALFAAEGPGQVVGYPTRQAIVRIDPTTEQVVASTVLPPTIPLAGRSVVVADGRLWVLLVGGANQLVLDSFYTKTLLPRGRPIFLDVPSGYSSGIPIVAAAGSTVYVGAGERIFTISARSGKIIRHFDLNTNRISAIGINGRNLFVGTIDQGLYTIDSTTGAELNHSPIEADLTIRSLVTAKSGIWLVVVASMQARIVWLSTADLSRDVTVSYAGSTQNPSVDVIGSTAWLGGAELVCADADTGAVRARVSVQQGRDGADDIGGIVMVRGRTFAIAHGGSPGEDGGLVELRPPAACTP